MYKKILVPLDGSATADAGLAAAIKLAQALGSRLRLVHVVEELGHVSGYEQFGAHADDLMKRIDENGKQLLRERAATVKAAGVEADTALFNKFGNHLAETVAEAARTWKADLIVVGTHGRRGVGRVLMGSGAEQIIRQAPVPVLVIRSDGPPAVPDAAAA
jgi:nucleotide-binding universal stress UspA family protein